MHPVKISFSLEVDIEFDFMFAEDMPAFGYPFVYLMYQTYIRIYSPVTGSLIKTIDFSNSMLKRLYENGMQASTIINQNYSFHHIATSS